MRVILAAIIATLLSQTAVTAQDRARLGYGRIVNNDFFGDGHDRGHTADLQASYIWGHGWNGRAPETIGELVELRFGAGILTPTFLRNPLPGDRPYAGYLSLGLHTHVRSGGWDWSTGVDVFATGPQTGLGHLQAALHDGFFGVPPSPQLLDNQIGNGLHPSMLVEIGRNFELGQRVTLRPFVEGRAGFETLLRAGVDITLGTTTRSDMLVRDMVTGQRYRAARAGAGGRTSIVLGADAARVSHSVLLPESRGYQLRDVRSRVRAGVHWQGARGDAFYGVTWMGKEFDGQPSDQLVGSIRLNLKF